MHTKLIELLSALEKVIDPKDGHHGIVVAYGRLALAMRLGDSSRVLFLDEGDLEKSTDWLVGEVLRLLESDLNGNAASSWENEGGK